jgi:hypothetical protein
MKSDRTDGIVIDGCEVSSQHCIALRSRTRIMHTILVIGRIIYNLLSFHSFTLATRQHIFFSLGGGRFGERVDWGF